MARGRPAAESGPFLKWAGGKGALLRHFESLYPGRFGDYHEPFLGAGAVFFRQAETGRIRKAHLSDVNPDLILVFAVVKARTAELIEELTVLQSRHSEERYYAERERFNRRDLGEVERAARVIYLNKTGYNGLYRVNSKGVYNVPFGRYVNPGVFSPKALWSAAAQLKRATVESRDFATVLERAKADDFVYFDPPYAPLSRSASFTKYAAGGFGEAEQERLARTFRELAERGVKVMLSNHDTPIMRKLYKGFPVTKIAVTRLINSNAARRMTPVGELVVRSFES